jgi:phage baseplate assembly protein W
MAIIDINKIKKPYVEDRDEDIFIGIDMPFRVGDSEGYFASTQTVLDATKNNIRNLLQTEMGERVFQPSLGIKLRRYLFEPFTDEIGLQIQNSIIDTFSFWLPFINIVSVRVNMHESTADIDNNTLKVFVEFSLKKDSTTIESVQVNIGE